MNECRRSRREIIKLYGLLPLRASLRSVRVTSSGGPYVYNRVYSFAGSFPGKAPGNPKM